MARKGQIEIPIAVDTGGVEKSIQNGLIEPLEDAEDALKNLGKTDGGKDIEKSMDKAQKSTEDLKDELDSARKDLGKLGFAAKDAGDDAKSGMDRAKDGVSEFKQEADSTAREAAASFDGSAESIGDAFQEVAANAFGGFGPAGAVAGIAAAAGIGLAVAGFEAVTEAQELSEEAAAEWADKFVEAGGRILGAAQLVAGVQEIATDPERYKVAGQNAKDWGVDTSTAMLAMAGDATALAVVQETLTARAEDVNRKLAEQEEQVTSDAGKVYDLADSVDRGSDSFSKLNGEMDAGAGRAKNVSDALVDLINQSAGATLEVDALGNKLYTLPDNTQVMVDAETGAATQNVTNFKGDVDGIKENVTTTVKVVVDDREWRNYIPTPKRATIDAVVNYGAPGAGRLIP